MSRPQNTTSPEQLQGQETTRERVIRQYSEYAQVRVTPAPIVIGSVETKPPYGNTGVTDSVFPVNSGVIGVHLDWLRYSVHWPVKSVDQFGLEKLIEMAFRVAVMPCEALKLTGEGVKNQYGYTVSRRLSHGLLQFNPQRPEMMIGVNFDGSDLAMLRSEGVTDLSHLWHVSICQGSITRLDIAVDYFGEGKVVDLFEAFRAGQVKTQVRKVKHIADYDQNGEATEATLYFGSRQSGRLLRVYNKAAQMGVPGSWLRIEIELHGEYAMNVANVIRDVGLELAGRQAIRDFVSCDTVSWYRGALEGEAVDIAPVPRKDTDTRRWLLGVVAPILERELEGSVGVGDFSLYDAFYGLLGRAAFRDEINAEKRVIQQAKEVELERLMGVQNNGG